MTSLNVNHTKITRIAIALFLGVLIVSGCSGSSDSQSPSETDAVNSDTVDTVADGVTTDSTNVIVDGSVENTPNGAEDGDTVSNDAETQDTIAIDTVTPEAMAPTRASSPLAMG